MYNIYSKGFGVTIQFRTHWLLKEMCGYNFKMDLDYIVILLPASYTRADTHIMEVKIVLLLFACISRRRPCNPLS